MKIPPDYARRIRSLRLRLDLTQSRLAELLGVSYASVNRWENGQNRPTALAWGKITEAERTGLAGFSLGTVSTVVKEDTRPYLVEQPQGPDFLAEPRVVRAVTEGERLSFGHLSNPTFAAEMSLVHPLPHQRIAVYDHMLPQPRLRFLLADDAGAGKTIMAGLYIREQLARRLIKRVLIIPPAGLVGNWQREMRQLFNLPFQVVTGASARIANPFVGPEGDLLIVSVDTLAGERMFGRLQQGEVLPYDLIIFDEAHKLAADSEPDFHIRKTDRYRLAEAVAGADSGEERWHLTWRAHHLLLLTATPHMGKPFPYYCLWRLLEPEVLSTQDAFDGYPVDARQRHFIRRTKEEMVRYDGTPIYPVRISDTFSYSLTQGVVSEQELYNRTTDYLRSYYNKAKILNRSAVRLAISVFQRRLASSTYALFRSFQRREDKLTELIDAIVTGKISLEELQRRQAKLDAHDVLDEKTADEEDPENGKEENESAQELALGAVVATSLRDLEVEREKVRELRDLAAQVYDQGQESKFDRLRELLQDPAYKDEKLIVFTEHRDTLEFLVRRLEALGFAGRVAQLHGGMDYQERDRQVAFFRASSEQGGASYLVATDAAGEGINLQFAWLMVNYDIPWNPARLEQRMGRIHRYGQKKPRVFIFNLVAGKTREGKVLYTLLTKLEQIRKDLSSEKVFDVVGRLFEGLSLKDYMQRVATGEATAEDQELLEGALSKKRVEDLQRQERDLYGTGGDVRPNLPELRERMRREELCRLLPGYVRRYLEDAAPLISIGLDGDLDGYFRLKPNRPGALDRLWPLLEAYPPERRDRLTVHKPDGPQAPEIYVHPGEPLFERLRILVGEQFSEEALRGSVFIDPTANDPYYFHVAIVTAARKADERFQPLSREEVLEWRLVGLRQDQHSQLQVVPVEHLLLLKGAKTGTTPDVAMTVMAAQAVERARQFAAEQIARPLAEDHQALLAAALPGRLDMLMRGYDLQQSELLTTRSRLGEKARAGDARAKADLARVRERQSALHIRQENTLGWVKREPELVVPGEVRFIAHALVMPSVDPEERARYDADVEAIAMQVVRAHEETYHHAVVRDVSTAAKARAAGLSDYPGFDMQSLRASGENLSIEVKGRAAMGGVELTENEWAKACILRESYWLYVVFECASPYPRLQRIRDPFTKLIAKQKTSFVIDDKSIFDASELD